MGFLSHSVKKEDIKPGDHIYTWRALFTYAHHGIYVGENKVIHFTSDSDWNLSSSCSARTDFTYACIRIDNCGLRQPNNGLIASCLDCFVEKGSLYLFQYGVSSFPLLVKRCGTCTTAKSDPPKTVIHRALYLLPKGFGKYAVFLNNCVDFALYCKTGLINKRGFGSSGQTSSIVGAAPASALLCSPLGLFMSAIGVHTDLCKVPVDDLVVNVGCRERTTEGSDAAQAQIVVPEKRALWSSKDSHSHDSLPNYCHCGQSLAILKTWTPRNPGRRYVACKNYDDITGRGCKSFKWYDEEQTSWQRDVINNLLTEKNELMAKDEEIGKLVVEKKEGKLEKLVMALLGIYIIACLGVVLNFAIK